MEYHELAQELLRRNEQGKCVAGLLETYVDTIRLGQEPFEEDDHFCIFLHGYQRLGDLHGARRAFQEAYDVKHKGQRRLPSTRRGGTSRHVHAGHLLRMYAAPQHRLYRSGLKLFFQLEYRFNVEWNTILCNSALKCVMLDAGRDGALNDGLCVYELMQERGIPVTAPTFASLFALIGRTKGRATEADRAFRRLRSDFELEKIKPNAHVYAAMIGCQKEYEPAKAYFRQMIGESIVPTVPVYNSVIQSCVKGQQRQVHANSDALLSTALQEYEEMERKYGLVPTLHTYSSLLTLCRGGKFARGNVPKALELLTAMQAEHGLVPNEQIYLKILYVCQAAPHDVESAFYVLNGMKSQGLRMSTKVYNALLACAGSLGPITMHLLKEMRAAQVPPDLRTYSALLGCCEDLLDGIVFFEEMNETGIVPNAYIYNRLIELCQRSGQHKQARQFYTEMREVGITPNAETLALMKDKL